MKTKLRRRLMRPSRAHEPQTVESVTEKEKDLPVAMDCTTVTLMDNSLSNPASLLAENQNCGVEAKDCHEGACSSAQNEKSLNSAIANQKQGQLKQGNSASLSGENQVFVVEVKADQESESSAPRVSPLQSGHMRRLLQGQICDLQEGKN